MASTGSAFEATLERDFYILLGWDKTVDRVEAQPLTLTYQDAQGVSRPYTPDALVFYKPSNGRAKALPPRLYEVKPRAKIKSEWPEIKRKYKAARRLARLQGWSFGFITETEIRTPYLDNIKFLRRHLRQPANAKHREMLLARLAVCGKTTPKDLIELLAEDKRLKAELLTALWKLIATEEIQCNLQEPLTMESSIYRNKKSEA